MANQDIDISEPLRICLGKFNGAEGRTLDVREKSLYPPFETLARKMAYGGYIRVRDEYVVFITAVEFYYHEEEGILKDPIVYHRDAMFLVQGEDQKPRRMEVPYFPVLTFNSHMSGIDITFENPDQKYRASALIREYVVYDIKAGAFIELNTSNKASKPVLEEDMKSFVGVILHHDHPIPDSRSSYLYYFLNGFSAKENEYNVQWVDVPSAKYGEVCKVEQGRVNANDHDWAYQVTDNLDYISIVVHAKDFPIW